MTELIEKVQDRLDKTLGDEGGRVAAYGIAWLLGVPLSLLVLIYLIRGH